MIRMSENFEVFPIGYVKRGNEVQIQLEDKYKDALLEVDNFSHLMVVWWGSKYAKYRDQVDMQMKPPYAPNVLTGLFATRSPVRPNPVNVSVCEIKKVNHQTGTVTVN
jgi:tRNA (Thr-GGU) A37 N-methylase